MKLVLAVGTDYRKNGVCCLHVKCAACSNVVTWWPLKERYIMTCHTWCLPGVYCRLHRVSSKFRDTICGAVRMHLSGRDITHIINDMGDDQCH